LFNLDINKLNPAHADPSIRISIIIYPILGAVYWHSDKAYIGFSIPNFIESKRYDDNEVAIFKEKINYYLIAGYAFDMNESIKFKPALLTKIVDGAPFK
jgi:hypothetical protein